VIGYNGGMNKTAIKADINPADLPKSALMAAHIAEGHNIADEGATRLAVALTRYKNGRSTASEAKAQISEALIALILVQAGLRAMYKVLPDIVSKDFPDLVPPEALAEMESAA
jgi:hypothetical protein